MHHEPTSVELARQRLLRCYERQLNGEDSDELRRICREAYEAYLEARVENTDYYFRPSIPRRILRSIGLG